MKKFLSLISIFLIMIILLTGCVEVNYNVKINEDGSADISYIYGFTKEYLTTNNINVDDAINSAENRAEGKGYIIEKYSDEIISGFKASKHFANVSEISLEEAFGEQYIQDIEEGKIKIEKKKSKTIYSQKASMDLTEMSGLESFVKMKYTVTLPIAVGKNNANEVSKDRKTLTWNLKTGEINEIQFEATKIKTVMLIVEIIALVMIVGAIYFGVLKLIKKYKENNKIISKKIKKDEKPKKIFRENKTTKKKTNKPKKDKDEK